MAARELIAVVVTGGVVYGPGYKNPPPDDVAATITNPSVWGEASDVDVPAADRPVLVEPVEHPHDVPLVPGAEPDSEPGEAPAEPHTPEPAVDTPAAPAEPVKVDEDEVPPRSGKGSGLTAWKAFADAHGVSYPEDASRDDIILACEEAKLI